MSESFPLSPDPVWYQQLVARHGEAVPPLEHMRFRRGLQVHVGELFETLSDLGLLGAVEIWGVETRSAAFAIIDARYKHGICEDDRIALDFALENLQERLAEACEHCGKRGAIVAKIGLEARLTDPDVELGDRLLCRECYEAWRSHD